jgi:hypothetical protein
MGEWQIITAGYFATEDFVSGPKWEEEVKMYSECSTLQISV